jgi:hypothetical protein
MKKKSVGLLELETAVLECFLEKTPLSPLGVKIKKTQKPQGPFVCCIDILQFFLQRRNKIVFKTVTFSVDTIYYYKIDSFVDLGPIFKRILLH